MIRRMLLTSVAVMIVALGVGAQSAHADSLTLVAGTFLTGSNSVTGNVTVTITDIGSTGNVRVTIANNTNGDLTNLALNYNTAVTGPITITNVSGTGPSPTSLTFGTNNVNAPGGARLDVNFGFPTGQPGGRLNAGETVSFNIDAASALLASGFNTLSVGGQQNFYIIAHIQAIAGSGDSAKLIGGPGNPTQPVPEPATMILLGTGLAGIAAKMRRKRKIANNDENEA
ncbi:MAG TPA: PEP-CTERM sorting domain-containing protein [Pyrinomonadaceae bacterium]